MIVMDEEAVPEMLGKWIEWWPGSCCLIMTGEEMLYECSECTAKFSEKSQYCHFCGAKMDVERSGDNGQ